MFPIQYTLLNPTLDLRDHRGLLPVGSLSKAVGIDGRYSGSVRPWPGMRFLRKLIGTDDHALGVPTFFKAVTIQKGNTTALLRGFVLAALDSTTGKNVLGFHYYDTSASAWAYYEISVDTSATSGVFGVAVQGKFLYVAQEGAAVQVVWHNGTNMTKADMGPGSFLTPVVPTTASSASTGGNLIDGMYSVCYRYRSTARDVYSGMSVPKVMTLVAGTGTQKITVGKTETTADAFDLVEVWRTISSTVAGDYFTGGLYYLDGTLSFAGTGSKSWTYDIVTSDVQIGQRGGDIYDPLLEEAGVPVHTGVIAAYQGVTFAGGSGGTGTDDRLGMIQWSPLHKFNPENFPSRNIWRMAETDGNVLDFEVCGDYLYALSNRSIVRFQKNGPQLLITPTHTQRGIVGANAACAVDSSVVLVTTAGVMVLNGASADLVQVGALDRLIVGDWAASLSGVVAVNDSVLGCVMLLNPTLGTAVCIWHGTNTVTSLEDMNFLLASGGSHPVSGGSPRSFFITNSCRVVYPDAERLGTKRTMMGEGGTVNGTSTTSATPNTTTLTDSAAAFEAASATEPGLAESYQYILSGTNVGYSRKITSNTGTVITCAAFPNIIAAEARYTISPVPVRLRMWPLGLSQDIGFPRYLFRRWTVKSLSVHLGNFAGEYTHANAVVTAGVYRQLGETMVGSADIVMAASASLCCGAVNVDGLVVEPGVEIVASNVDFELIAVQVKVEYSNSEVEA